MAIKIHSSRKREEKDGGGVVYEFWLYSIADVANLPKPGDWAADTSSALIIPTGEALALGDNGWVKIGAN